MVSLTIISPYRATSLSYSASTAFVSNSERESGVGAGGSSRVVGDVEDCAPELAVEALGEGERGVREGEEVGVREGR